jgi:pyridoxamine 5'-phosphate oxidase
MTRPIEPDVTDLEAVLASCWTSMTRGAADRRHGFHHPVVANVSAEGKPRSRVVILRSADTLTKTLRFHTDVRTEKSAELVERPAVSVTLYDAASRVQIKIDGCAVLHNGDALAKAAWTVSQPMSRIGYGTLPAPGSSIAAGSDFALPVTDEAIAAGAAHFCAVVIHVEKLEWLFLRSGGHRRAVFDIVAGKGQWLVP